MAALVFPEIVRYTIVGNINGEDCMNILDVKLSANGSTASRDQQISRVAGDILNNWSDHIVPVLHQDYVAEEVRFVDLDDEDGITGSVSSTDGSTWPENGGATGAGMSNNVYVKMVKVLSTHSRTSRNGALRLSGIPAITADSGVSYRVSEEWRTGFNDRFEDFKDGINGIEELYETNIGVLHTVDKVATGFTFMQAFRCAPNFGTIRRRMPGYGD